MLENSWALFTVPARLPPRGHGREGVGPVRTPLGVRHWPTMKLPRRR